MAEKYLSAEVQTDEVIQKIKQLQNNARIFKIEIAFDPLDNSKVVKKFFTYPNGFLGYIVGDEEVGLSLDGSFLSYTYKADGESQFIRADVDDNGIYGLQKSDGTLIGNFNPNSDVFPDDPIIKCCVLMYKSAKEFYKNLRESIKQDFSQNVTMYEDGDSLIYEESHTHKIVEKSDNGIINGEYTCNFAIPDKGQHGHTSDTYTVNESNGETNLINHSVMMVG